MWVSFQWENQVNIKSGNLKIHVFLEKCQIEPKYMFTYIAYKTYINIHIQYIYVVLYIFLYKCIFLSVK